MSTQRDIANLQSEISELKTRAAIVSRNELLLRGVMKSTGMTDEDMPPVVIKGRQALVAKLNAATNSLDRGLAANELQAFDAAAKQLSAQ